MSTEKEPDFAAMAQRIAVATITVNNYRDMGDLGMAARRAYAFCMEARLRSDWETIRLLREVQSLYLENGYDGEESIAERLSKLLEPFTP